MDKVKIARSFSRSAETYDQVAYLQRDVGLHLVDILQSRLEPKKTDNDFSDKYYLADLGCGTGFFQKKLTSLFGEAHYIGLDLAEGMLRYTKAQQEQSNTPLLVCADAETLPFANASVNCFFSNMALQWCNDIHRLFAEAYRVLSPGGLFVLTTLGPNTLQELKAAWAQVDDLVHVNDFYSTSDWQQAMESNRFVVDTFEKKYTVLEYALVQTLLKELKLLGAHNINDGQRKTLTGPKRLKALLAAYEHNCKGQYSATYEVDYWVLKKPSGK